MSDEKPPHLARRMYVRFVIAFFVIVALSGGVTAASGLLEVQDVVDILKKGAHLDVGDQLTAAEAGKPQTILIFGSDHRVTDAKGAGSRSDTIMLVHMDPDRGTVTLLSVPRDLKVHIKLPNGAVQTDKINAAYSLGGPKLATATVKSLLGVQINHVVNINFHLFKAAVNRIGCVYVDIDRRYYHVNVPGQPDWAEINIPAGYQRLCGDDALSYVRFRHTDNDLVRASRQHDFLTAAKEQVEKRGLADISQIKTLAKLLAHYTDTDIRSTQAVIQLVRLALYSSQKPMQTIPFPAQLGPEYVTATPQAIHKAVHQFLNPPLKTPSSSSKHSSGKRRHGKGGKRKARHSSGAVPGLMQAGTSTEDLGVEAATQHHLGFPVFYPKLITSQGHIYTSSGPNDPNPRVYRLDDEARRKHKAYRMVFTLNPIYGEYWGVQGTDWDSPPILAQPHDTVRSGGRRYRLYYDGSHLKLVAFRARGAVYWVSNTLGDALTNKQMLGIAESLTDRYR